MAQEKKQKRKNAAGNGNIRQRKDGTWEARYSAGFDPKTGKPIRRSIYGKTQREVSVKLRQITNEIDTDTYVAPCEMKLNTWLDTWLAEYLTGRSPLTTSSYENNCRNYIRPVLGNYRLDAITPVMIQKFVNGLSQQGLPPKTVKNIHGVIHRALEQAVRVGYLRTNPATVCNLPKIVKPKITPFTDEQITDLISELQATNHKFATLDMLPLRLRWMYMATLMIACVTKVLNAWSALSTALGKNSKLLTTAPVQNFRLKCVYRGRFFISCYHTSKTRWFCIVNSFTICYTGTGDSLEKDILR